MMPETIETPTVDMSSEAIDRRFRMVEALRKLCVSLKEAGERNRSLTALTQSLPQMNSNHIEIVEGDLLDQEVDVIVNAWNRNVIPWWLLLPQGVSGAIKRRGGILPFREVARYGPIPLGGAVLTSAGKLPFKGIIHVAGINLLWMATEYSIRNSVHNAVVLAEEKGFESLAMPLIGAGSGRFNEDKAQSIMLDELNQWTFSLLVKVVVFRR